jgi:mono/diheme cytochrome c family protein
VAGQYPPLAGSEWVNYPSPHRILRAVLYGLTGPITVSGKQFNGTMVPWKTLSDEDIAAALTYVRGNKEWGNSASPVTPQQVKAIRDKVGDRGSSFAPAELENLPEDK